MRSVHLALMDSFGIPNNDCYQRLYELEKDFFDHGERTDQFTLIELTIFPGRSNDLKRKAIKRITERLQEDPGIEPSDVFIVINEPTLENWGLRGDQASMPGLSYKKD
jgi:phenylpyruvate tautomerase PptA (4-oxalocrotonate tautomerase family)